MIGAILGAVLPTAVDAIGGAIAKKKEKKAAKKAEAAAGGVEGGGAQKGGPETLDRLAKQIEKLTPQQVQGLLGKLAQKMPQNAPAPMAAQAAPQAQAAQAGAPQLGAQPGAQAPGNDALAKLLGMLITHMQKQGQPLPPEMLGVLKEFMGQGQGGAVPVPGPAGIM